MARQVMLRTALCLAALAAACAAEPDPRAPLAASLKKIGFQKTAGLSTPQRLVLEKPAGGLTISVLLPLPAGAKDRPAPAAGGELVVLILVSGPAGAQGPEQDRVYLHNPDLHQVVAAASQGVYPARAAAEILTQAHRSSQQNTGTGAVLTSPKQGFALTVLFREGHLAQVGVIRHPPRTSPPDTDG